MCGLSYQMAFSTRNHGWFAAGSQSSTAGLTSSVDPVWLACRACPTGTSCTAPGDRASTLKGSF
jgi:hypothetical protein